MPPAAMAGVAIGSAVLSAYGKYKAGKDQAAAAERAAGLSSPRAIMSRFQQYNPQLYSAAYGPNIFGQAPTGNFADYMDWQTRQAPKVAANPLAAMFQMPGYMDPSLMNQGLQDIDRSYASSIIGGGNFAAQMGMAGGLADMYSFAAQAARQRAQQDVWQNFQTQQAQLSRQDIAQGQGMIQQGIAQAQGGAGQQAGYTAQAYSPYNWATGLGEVGAAAVTARGALPPGGAQAAPQTYPTMPQGQGPQMFYQNPMTQFNNQWQGAPRKFSGFENFGSSYNDYLKRTSPGG